MKRYTQHRLWIVGIATLALLSFFAGTSLACFEKGVGTVRMAEDCGKDHCQHVMVGAIAATCCQSHHTKVSQALPVAPSAKTIVLVASTLPGLLIAPVVGQAAEHCRAHLSTAERPPPSPPLYTLHCTLLI
jgi:hypothetical protein